jgi:ABC-2 type transport system ATP-binding protein
LFHTCESLYHRRAAALDYPEQMSDVIRVRGLRKSYGELEAVRGIDFAVGEGEVFGLLGPNGAGKTTTVEILEGLRARTSGEVSVLGRDPSVGVAELKQCIGVCLQATNLPDKITVWEALALFAAFYNRNTDRAALLQRLQLEEKRDAYYNSLSGGQKQRVALALALLNDPQLLFLDEPTTGLDPQVRLEIHGLIQELKDARRTIVLTTHYIEEAERLCDRVAIIDEGRVIAMGTPRELQARTIANSRIDLLAAEPLPDAGMPAFVGAGAITLNSDRRGMSIQSALPAKTLVDVVKWMDQAGVSIEDIRLHRPTLEDVFIELTGKKLRD